MTKILSPAIWNLFLIFTWVFCWCKIVTTYLIFKPYRFVLADGSVDKSSATKPDNMSVIPGTYMVKKRNDYCKLSSDLHLYDMLCVSNPPPHKSAINNFKAHRFSWFMRDRPPWDHKPETWLIVFLVKSSMVQTALSEVRKQKHLFCRT